MTTAIKTASNKNLVVRSNRPLTEFACRHLDAFLESRRSIASTLANGNTTVAVRSEPTHDLLKVFLFNDEILSVTRSARGTSVRVSFTSYYDHFGQPTATTCERLNGLLDRLGCHEVLPTGVRVFRDHSSDEPLTYLGRGDDKIAVGEGLAESVYIKASPIKLNIIGTELSHDVA